MIASEKRASVVHQGNGRTRLRFKSERGNKPFFDGLVPRLSALPDIVAVEARPLTGSVLVHHQGPWVAIAERAAADGLFVLLDEALPVPVLDPLDLRGAWPGVAKQLAQSGLFAAVNEEQVVKSFEALGRRSALPPPLIAAGSLAALALLQLARGRTLPPAITLLWYARALASPFVATLNKK